MQVDEIYEALYFGHFFRIPATHVKIIKNWSLSQDNIFSKIDRNLKTSMITHWYKILILSKGNSFALAFSLFSSFVRKICFEMNEDEISL